MEKYQERLGNHEENEKRAKPQTAYIIHCLVLTQSIYSFSSTPISEIFCVIIYMAYEAGLY